MSSGPTHRATAGIVAFAAASVLTTDSRVRDIPHPIVAGGLATIFTNLPDILEPAVNPHHRQFFHSVVFASGIVYGLKRAYEWEPKDACESLLRHLALIAGSAYLIHLALDACTSHSLPLLGK